MACYHPVKAFRCADGGVVFTELARYDLIGDISLPCGQCIGCRIDRAREWSVRCLHESKLHKFNSFVTLTYRDEDLPPGRSLDYRDYQLFMKRLRKSVGIPVRFFMCGEYGEKDQRPHYHALLFGYQFPDLKFWSRSPTGNALYRSEILEGLWTKGNSLIGQVTRESAGYVARYCMKKVTGDLAKDHYRVEENGVVFDRVPEFARMSLKPGIGAEWFAKYHSDVFPHDYVIADGIKIPVPRYYDRLGRETYDLEGIKFRRETYGRAHAQNNTDERLAVREEVAKARLKSLARKI